MIFGDKMIRERIWSKGFVQGAKLSQINPASMNICLGNTFLIPAPPNGKIVLGQKVEYERYEVKEGGSMGINPGEFMLATTKEKITMPPNVAGFVQGRSSIGRIALTVQNAGFIDPGFCGHITLELVNETDYLIELIPGYPVAQIVFFDVSEVLNPYRGKYNGQIEATGSRMYMDKACEGGLTVKRCDLPFRWRVHYQGERQCSLISLGEVLDSGNPNFAVEEKEVQNGIVRFFGAKPPTKFSPILVERADGTLWKIDLSNFKTFEIITELED